MKIVNLGSMNVDYVYRVDKFLVAGETKASQSRAENAGGKGLNQSVAAARAGAEVQHAGYIGAGAEILVDALTRGGVHMDLMERRPEVPTGHTFIQVDDIVHIHRTQIDNFHTRFLLFLFSGGSAACSSALILTQTERTGQPPGARFCKIFSNGADPWPP